MQGPGSLGVVSEVVIAGGSPSNGLFIYTSNPPATGTLTAAITPAPAWPTGATDPYGNPYYGTIFTIDPTFKRWVSIINSNVEFGSNATGTHINGVGAVSIADALTTTIQPALIAQSPNANAGGRQSFLYLFGGNNSGTLLQQVVISPTAALNNAQTSAFCEIQGELAVNGVEAIVGGVAETWHSVSLPAGWTGTARVKILAESNFAIFDAVVVPNAVSGTFGSFPSAAYYPLTAREYPVGYSGGTSSSANPRTVIPTSGAITMGGLISGTTVCITQPFPLD